MKNIHELLVDRRIGVISAHPDDHLISGHAVMAAHAVGAPVRELTLTKGGKSTVNHHPDKRFVADGRRDSEGQLAAEYMGIISNDHLNGTDGNLIAEQDEHVPVVAEWIDYHGIDLLLTLGGVTDHSDHIASAAIARQATMRLWNDDSYFIDILETQLADTGEWQARVLPEGQATIFGAAALHASQMLVARCVQPGWEQVPGDLWVHPDTIAGLGRYPIRRSATFMRPPPAMFGQQVIIEQAAGPQ